MPIFHRIEDGFPAPPPPLDLEYRSNIAPGTRGALTLWAPKFVQPDSGASGVFGMRVWGNFRKKLWCWCPIQERQTC